MTPAERQSRLRAFLRPDSIAIVGAGERPTSSGGALLRSLEVCGWPGRVVPVNPKGGVIRGLPACRSLAELDAPADLVAVLVRPDHVLSVVEEAAATGHRNLLILPGGFAEAGEAGRARDLALRALAERHDLLVGGPNCAGLINLLDPARPFAPTFFRDMPRGGPVALVSQSGAIIEEMITASHTMRLPLGAVVSVGNGLHLDLTDYLEYLGEDPACAAVLLYAESFGDLRRFARVAARVAARKPVVALIGGRTPAGRAAALRHTGSVALDEAAADALCAACGVLRVRSLRELKLASRVLGSLPDGTGPRVLTLSNSGGPGVLASDRAVQEGLTLVELPAPVAASLQALLPPEAAVANPMDLLADAREDRFGPCLDVLAEGMAGAVDLLLMIHVVPFMVDAAPVVEAIATRAAGLPFPVLHTMMGTLEQGEAWAGQLDRAGVPLFGDGEEMCTAAGLLARRQALRAVARAASESSGETPP